MIAREPRECITLSAAVRKVMIDNSSIALAMLSTMADRIAELDRQVLTPTGPYSGSPNRNSPYCNLMM